MIINKIKDGKDVAVVSDAGTPGISDPGEEVIKEAINENICIKIGRASCRERV